jgi:TRAP-type transport system small permease protein
VTSLDTIPPDAAAPEPHRADSSPRARGLGVRYSNCCRQLARGCMCLAMAGIVALICAVTWQVIGRYLLNNTPSWAESLALLLVLYVTMFGTAVAVRDSGHIGLESFLVLAPEHVRLKMEYVIHALILLFGALMAWNCASLAQSVWGYRLPTLWISEGWRYVPSAIAGVLIVLFSIEHLIALRQGREVEASWT